MTETELAIQDTNGTKSIECTPLALLMSTDEIVPPPSLMDPASQRDIEILNDQRTRTRPAALIDQETPSGRKIITEKTPDNPETPSDQEAPTNPSDQEGLIHQDGFDDLSVWDLKLKSNPWMTAHTARNNG